MNTGRVLVSVTGTSEGLQKYGRGRVTLDQKGSEPETLLGSNLDLLMQIVNIK